MFTIQKLYGRWFCGDFYGHITTKGYFHCFDHSCPFSVKVSWPDNDSNPVVEKMVFALHCHEFPGNSKMTNRQMMEDDLKVIERGQDVGNGIANKHELWQEKAKDEGKSVLKGLSDRDDVVDYACQHPQLSGREVELNTGEKMSRFAIDMARLREMKKRDEPVMLSQINTIGKHHLLKRDGDEIVIFGLKSSVRTMAAPK